MMNADRFEMGVASTVPAETCWRYPLRTADPTSTDAASARSRKAAFTLIELLAVIGIMAIILVIALPAFDSFKLKGTQSAIPQINSTLRLARQYAITHRQEVYVVFPDGRSAYSPASEVNKAICSYAVIVSNRTTGRFEYVTEWKYLPKGVFFDAANTATNSVFYSYGPGNSMTYFPFPNDGNDDWRNLCAVKFRPNGRAYVVTGSKNGWTCFSNTRIPVTAGYVEVDTNTGLFVKSISLSETNVIWIANMTGQIYMKNE